MGSKAAWVHEVEKGGWISPDQGWTGGHRSQQNENDSYLEAIDRSIEPGLAPPERAMAWLPP